jgi:drug/metabolite transporter (DMT)-like permease
VLAWLLLGEQPSPLAILGLVVASAGCWLVSTAKAVPLEDAHQ